MDVGKCDSQDGVKDSQRSHLDLGPSPSDESVNALFAEETVFAHVGLVV